MRWDEQQLGRIISDLKRDYAVRDSKAAIRRALLFRRSDFLAEKTGTHVPEPFNESKLIVRTMTGKLMYMTQHLVAKGTANQPKPQVNVITTGGVIAERLIKKAADEERALAGIWYSADGRRAQRICGFSQVTQGCGWLVSRETAAAWGLPDREYYDELTDDEVERLASSGKIAVALGERGRMPERADLWARRKAEASKQRALSGSSLFSLEAFGWDQVYARYDRKGTALIAIIENIPSTDFGPGTELAKSAGAEEYGLIKTKDGKIVKGTERGSSDADLTGDFWTLATIMTRDEIYYYVCTAAAAGGGAIVFSTEHDYGEVPAWPAPFTETDSVRPEERYIGALEAAFAIAPGLNQLTTLLSNVAAWNTIPRFIVMMPDGRLAVDPDTSEPFIIRGEPTVGLDPKQMGVINAGGQVVQLTIENAEVLFQLVEFYTRELAGVLPSESAVGQGGQSGPAWTTRLLQEAQSLMISPMVEGHADAVASFHRMVARTVRRRGEKLYLLSAPGFRRDDRARRALIEIDAGDWTDNISVRQDSNTLEERITLDQVGLEKLDRGVIDDWEYFEEYAGEDDPQEAIFRKYKKQGLDHLIGGVPAPPGSLIAMVVDAVRGLLPAALAETAPNVAQNLAQGLAGTGAQPQGFGGGVAEIAGVRQPGMGMGADLPAMPAPGGGGLSQGAAPVVVR